MSPSCLTMPTFTHTFLAKADLKKSILRHGISNSIEDGGRLSF